jgi:hypothetical protein
MKIAMNTTRLTHDEELDHLETVLTSLPLATEEFSTAMNHLRNARAYFRQGKVGAGLFEAQIVIAAIHRAS